MSRASWGRNECRCASSVVVIDAYAEAERSARAPLDHALLTVSGFVDWRWGAEVFASAGGHQ